MATQTQDVAPPVDSEVLEKVGNLIRLSQSPNEEEARTAAMQATRLMAKHKLVLVPLSEIQRVKERIAGAEALAKEQKDAKMQNMLLGAAAGFFAAKKGLF